jgi:7-carboxy-7-deazaguanine synthase
VRLLEHYISTQGEGPRVGLPTQFVRFAGCNLRCPGWPCDTPFAIDPTLFRHEQKLVTSGELAEACINNAMITSAKNVCLTGGEPFLQNKGELLDLVQQLREAGLSVEMFTNGTYLIEQPFLEAMSFTMDWKLRGSGEFMEKYEDVRLTNIANLDRATKDGIVNAVKFVCKNTHDMDEAINVHWKLSFDDRKLQAFFGVVWESPDLTAAQLVEELIGRNVPNWRLNVQVHNHIWPAHERAR